MTPAFDHAVYDNQLLNLYGRVSMRVWGEKVTNRELGAAGEDAACAFLRRKGYRIMDRNYRCSQGELDVIASKRGRLVFCEVKARSGGEIEEALGAVDAKRQGRMARAASHYLNAEGRVAKDCRFDVIALLKDGPTWKIVHVEDAFEIGEL
ncbi:MAG: YraN family protein [Actinobacteria bacterium]|nr:MAG: YraN family protein [Actinomycetota bacterium]